MIRRLVLFAALLAATPLAAQKPLYIVNGTPCDEIAGIETDDIERIEELPADEESIARYGDKATNGVILITLKYDSPAVFEGGEPFADHIARQVKWGENEPAARVALRYTVTAEGEERPPGRKRRRSAHPAARRQAAAGRTLYKNMVASGEERLTRNDIIP